MTIKLLICSALITLGSSKIVSYKDCGSVDGKVSGVDLSPCDAEPCELKHGYNVTVKVNYTALANSSTAKTVVHGIIGGVPVPFPVASDCCGNHNLKCPIVAGTADVYNLAIYCSPSYPKIKLIVKLEVQDDAGKDLMCLEVPAVIGD